MFAEHAKIQPKELLDYSLPEIEYMISGFSKNNQKEEDKPLTGEDAINALRERGLLT